MEQYEKIYVSMILYVDRDGKMTPTDIEWEDGRKYHVDKVIKKRTSPPEHVGASVTRRYDVIVEGRKKILYLDTTTS